MLRIAVSLFITCILASSAFAYPPADAPRIEIVSPENGAVVLPGETITLNVKADRRKLPTKIIIVAFGAITDDKMPGNDNDYTVNIPADAPEGMANISVIGHWINPNGKIKKQVVSRNVVIYVNPGPPASP